MTLYLDTSSLVKLYVTEPGSDLVRTLVESATIVATSSIAYAEARAALASGKSLFLIGLVSFDSISA